MAAVWGDLVVLALAALVVRHALVAVAVLGSVRFLRTPDSTPSATRSDAGGRWYIVLPVLRERAVADALCHFRAVAAPLGAGIIVVTTEREYAERRFHPRALDTVRQVRDLAASGQCVHLHCADPVGVKADQLNCAASWVAGLPATEASRTFLVCYDVDSRPPPDSLSRLQQAVREHPEADVFHQSACFRLVTPAHGRVCRALLDAGALRANRFVLAYELPRLLNRLSRNRWRAWLSAGTYAHVTGHGLCLRLALLTAIPFPAHTPLEDMYWSFILGTRAVRMVPIRSLDVAEVPGSLRAQVRQASRWVVGPARAWRYLRHPASRPSATAYLMALSATAITLEWASCAVVPILLMVLLVVGQWPLRTLSLVFIACYGLQLIVTDMTFGSRDSLSTRLGRLLLYPVNSTLFGVGGLVGIGALLVGNGGAGKTERVA